MNKSTSKARKLNKVIRKLLPWFFSLLMTLALVITMLLFKTNSIAPEETVTLRSIDVVMRLPPPPPPEIQQTEVDSSSATINLIGMGEGPKIKYSDVPTLAKPKKSKLTLPKFDIDSLNLGQAVSVIFLF